MPYPSLFQEKILLLGVGTKTFLFYCYSTFRLIFISSSLSFLVSCWDHDGKGRHRGDVGQVCGGALFCSLLQQLSDGLSWSRARMLVADAPWSQQRHDNDPVLVSKHTPSYWQMPRSLAVVIVRRRLLSLTWVGDLGRLSDPVTVRRARARSLSCAGQCIVDSVNRLS